VDFHDALPTVFPHAAGIRDRLHAAGVRDRLHADFFSDGRHSSLVVVNVGHPARDASRDRLPRLEYEDVVSVA
jgi:3-hydroxypropanoate dehydrogenase